MAGVLGGFAEHWEVDSKKLRVVYVLATVLSAAFPGVLIYLVLWYVLPWRD